MPDFCHFFAVFPPKKICVFLIPEKQPYIFQSRKLIRTKNRILFFCVAKLIAVNPTTGNLCMYWHPPEQQQLLCLDGVIFISHTVTDSCKCKSLLSKVLSYGFYTGNHRVSVFQPQGFGVPTHRVLILQDLGLGVPAIGCGTPKTQVLQTLNPGSYRLRNLGLGALKGGSCRIDIWRFRL